MRKRILVLGLMAAACAVSQRASAALLAVDFNERTVPWIQKTELEAAGFSQFYFPAVNPPASSDGPLARAAVASQTFGAYTVSLGTYDDDQDEQTITAGTQLTDGSLDDRLRTPNASLVYAFPAMYRDVVFAAAANGPTGGMDLTVGGFAPNTTYRVGIYSFDHGSSAAPQPRTAQWLDGNAADALVLATSFGGGDANLPTTDDQYLFTGLAVTDATGKLLLKGRSTTPTNATGAGAVNIGVFINGFTVEAVPEPSSLALALAALGLTGCVRRRRQA